MNIEKLSHRYALLIAALFSVLITLVLLLFSVSVALRTAELRDQLLQVFSNSHENYVSSSLLDNASYLSERLFDPLYRLDISTVNAELRHISNWLKPMDILVLDADGLILTDGSDNNQRYGRHVDLPKELGQRLPLLLSIDDDMLLFFPVAHAGQLAGFVRIVLDGSLDHALALKMDGQVQAYWHGFMYNFLLVALSGLALVIVMALGMVSYLRRSLSEPLVSMTEAAEEYARGNLGYQLDEQALGHGEVRRLGSALTQMAADLSHAERRIMRQANFDALTGLPNRFYTLQELERLLIAARRNQNRVAVIYFDLDEFKLVNDTLGHEAGDQLLVESSRRIRSVIGEKDIAGRLGGDEFLILMSLAEHDLRCQALLQRLVEAFRKPFVVTGARDLVITVSAGVAICPDDASDLSGLLRHADVAMYKAKEAGRNGFRFFEEPMMDEIRRQMLLEQKIRESLLNNHFYLSYQPQFDIRSGELVGCEALLRWRCDVLGDVPSEEFIPLAERTGLIVPLGEMVWRAAMSQLAAWRELRPDFAMAVNLSPRQFRSRHLTGNLLAVVNEYGLDTAGITVEITEGLMIDSHLDSSSLLEGLRRCGFSVAMDDFGTGYSSLSHLRQYPFDVLKVDKSFVQALDGSHRDREMLKGMMQMAHALGLKVVAEGIETPEQLRCLQDIACDTGQGYLFCRPVAADDITRSLETGPVECWALAAV